MSNQAIIIKTPEQIDGIRKSGALAAKTLDFITPHVVEGVTTNELDAQLETFIQEHKAIPAPKGYQVGDLIYPKATCISINEVVCHGIPSERKLRDGDILNIDVTTILDGYYGDTSRMFLIGNVSKVAVNLCHHTQKALFAGIATVKPGVHFGDIGAAIGQYAHANDYSVVTAFCGHGTGVDFHEAPNVPHLAQKNTGPVMHTGIVFTIEPMINIGTSNVVINEQDGWTASTADAALSAQWEHTIVITNNGYEILTLSELTGT